MRRLVWIGSASATLALLLALDAWLSRGVDEGVTQRQLAAAMDRFDVKPNASVLILGSSTSSEWIDPVFLGRSLGVAARDVLDGHMNT